MAGLRGGILFGVLGAIKAAAPSCKSDSGADVDFTYAFKYPGSFEYAYMDENNKLAKSSKTLNTDSSSITATLKQIHDAGVSFVMWNDQPPPDSDTKAPQAHAKGVLAFSNSGGFWLTHSLPHFPSMDAQNVADFWAAGSDIYGQSFLCITLDAVAIHDLSPVFKINQPHVYVTDFATGATETFPDVKEWAVNREWDTDTMTKQVQIRSLGGRTFNVFGKSGLWGDGKDLYRDLVAPAVGDLYMEGWRHGAGVWGPACGTNKVYDILAVSFPEVAWRTTQDHSKWAVGQSGSLLCVGDINRGDGQDKRGGGTVCIHDDSFASQLRSVISGHDTCQSGSTLVV
jgi:deoxyribonuclease-2|eukprot:TRINITY_DN15059_c0_g1_i1.p1 TRINITY_DN15059_c0_g1~~TRINITY_DN15059_c0_g1_i1.p1  ORF type:complete len:342 (+),score=50.09 TRINITY_DN15059_c0_g1_i1:93-1118(+)